MIEFCQEKSESIEPIKHGVAYDLSTPYDFKLKGRENKTIDLLMSIKIEKGICGRIIGRSGLAFKYDIDVHQGLIDDDYTGNIMIRIRNLSDNKYNFKRGDRIAQILFIRYVNITLKEVTKMEESEHKGFGSTGD